MHTWAEVLFKFARLQYKFSHVRLQRFFSPYAMPIASVLLSPGKRLWTCQSVRFPLFGLLRCFHWSEWHDRVFSAPPTPTHVSAPWLLLILHVPQHAVLFFLHGLPFGIHLLVSVPGQAFVLATLDKKSWAHSLTKKNWLKNRLNKVQIIMVLLEHSWRMFQRQCMRFQQFSHHVSWLLQQGPFFHFFFSLLSCLPFALLGLVFLLASQGKHDNVFSAPLTRVSAPTTAFSAVFAQCVKWPFAGYRNLLPLCFFRAIPIFQMSLEQIIPRMVPCLLIFLVLCFGAWWPDLLTLSADQPWRDAIEILRYDSWYDEYTLTTAQNMVLILHLPSFFSP